MRTEEAAREAARSLMLRAGFAIGAVAVTAACVAAIVAGPALSGEPRSSAGEVLYQPRADVVPTKAVDNPLSVGPPLGLVAVADGATAGSSGAGAGDIPAAAVSAYRNAETMLAQARPGCGLDWSLVAAIGKVESNHGRFGGAVLGDDGISRPRIRGPRLDGVQFALIRDTDGGRLDGDTQFDRAVGPMQFVPATWQAIRADGNGDGVADPDNIFDAAAGAGAYLCSGGGDLRVDAARRAAVLRYNHSDEYVNLVLSIADGYRGGAPGGAGGPDPVLAPEPPVRSSVPSAAPTTTAPITVPASSTTPTTAPAPTSTGHPSPTTSPVATVTATSG
ncbi:lytic transglycosylase domain-containing protein [Amycolatopsis sp. cmx-4-61]|uniref:lytic transglycosylase domain-containing protein n=1 Tax=Amycolatopsis sp. cmx-4-61 TaxID=2790937 RepID=UPI0039784C2B